MAKEQSTIRERERLDVREPRRYQVIIFNDDFTTMEFVVRLLISVFHKSPAEAEQLMMMVHRSEKAVVGIYSYDVAVSKVQRGLAMARQEGFPLRLTYQPEE
ncbi:MAG: ATP-dependent Clp protease adaptor ClpS [Prevotella sp.]|nr:ATP-dependent Clp protease adaptor ClpS [Prevotella sp.]